MKPAAMPSIGEKARPNRILRIPDSTRTPHPAWAMPAPASPAIKLWLPLTGIPKRDATNTHVAAAATPPATVSRVIASGLTTPVPTTLATAVPEIAPTKFIPAAMMTAARGDITRVDTTVAIAFAESLKPLAKSKATAINMTIIRNASDVESSIRAFETR